MNARFLRLAPALAALVLALPAAAAEKTYAIDPAASTLGFGVRHIVTTVNGSFKDFSGTITADPANPATARAQVAVRTASVETENDKRDAHLGTADFFDSANKPEMTFVLDKVEPTGPGTAVARGNFTLLGVTKPIELQVTELAMSDTAISFKAATTLNREDYGMTYNKVNMIGADVALELVVKAVAK